MKISSSYFIFIFLTFSSFFLYLGCTTTKVIRKLHDPQQLNSDSLQKAENSLKVHMYNGDLYVLSGFRSYPGLDTLIGQGNFYNANREKISTRPLDTNQLNFGLNSYKIPYSAIAMVETNSVKGVSGKLLTMSLVGVPSVAITVYCITNPKACFGSCPTFYAPDGENMKLMAEGFSSSILRAFEKSDIDLLYWSKNKGKEYCINLRNEALETHVIRYADLLVFPRKRNERIFATEDGKFFKTSSIQSPLVCKAAEGDCRNMVAHMDGKERFSEADAKNLAAHEYIELEFNAHAGVAEGLLIGARQTLLTTYLFYQSLAYFGNANGYLASRIESGDKVFRHRVEKVWDLLGGIEIFVQNSSGKWIKAGKIEEMGPIATDVHLVPMPSQESGTIKVRIKMTKGLWRIDYIGLADIKQDVQPVRIKPSLVITNDTINNLVLSQLCDSVEPLITLPGDSYLLQYTLPDSSNDYEIYLKSKGYYLEWMREEWMAEEDLKKAYLMFGMPKLYLKRAAAKFKVAEPLMEETFWNSKYVKN